MNRRADLPARKSDITRARIKEALVTLVGKKPAAEVTISDICEAASMTHGGFYFHFKNKDQALIEIAEEWLRDFKVGVLNVLHDDDFLTEICNMIGTYIEGYMQNIALTRVVYSLDPQKTGIRSVYNYYHDRWLARLEARFRAERHNAGLEAGLEAMLAHAVTSALEGLCVKTYLLELPDLAHYRDDPDILARDVSAFWCRSVLGSDIS